MIAGSFSRWLFQGDDRAPVRAAKLLSVVALLMTVGAIGYRVFFFESSPRLSKEACLGETKRDGGNSVKQVAAQPRLRRQMEPPKPADEKKLGVALNRVALENLVRNLKLAAARGDDITKNAMVSALKRHPAEAREFLKEEIRRARDGVVAVALSDAMREMDPWAKGEEK